MRQGETVGGFRVREIGRIEVQAEATRPGPGNPVLEIAGFDLVAVHFPAAELTIESVEVEPVFAGNQRERLFEVGAKFVGGARFARIIAGDS